MENNGFGYIGIELHKMNDVEIVDVKGKRCVSIPIDENGIYISEKGGMYLSFVMTPRRKEKWGRTHDLKRKLTSEEYKSLSKEQKESVPECGYYQPWRPKEDSESGSSNNGGGYQQTKTAPAQQRSKTNSSYDDLSGLPF